ncbi:hypothetical protein ACFYT3_24620 [Nocardia amikacinitolerans]|uniref:hypothetical protein n=1 Tax=Nocardia amikacinitolerans TaxID=756689 RepID=UPI0020A560DC|nr:hypothetical protein [Nocardia amikacinitolerans]MCP2292953.1 hypothetical protein [Nocardia amikacinitolerans]
MRATCPTCESAVDHCHGTLIIHAARMPECTDDDCIAFDHARHAFIIDCADLAGGCACTTQPSPSRRQA